MSQILTIAGSPCSSPKSSAILNHTQRLLRRHCVHSSAIAVRDLPPADLMYARINSLAIQQAYLAIEEAQGVIITTPVYKSANLGGHMAFLDLLPPDALKDKVVLPIGTSGCSSYLLAPDLSEVRSTHTLRNKMLDKPCNRVAIRHACNEIADRLSAFL